MALFPSEEWLQAYRDAINASDDYRRLGADWEGDITYVIQAEPDKGVPQDVCAWVDLWHGQCRDVRIVSIDEGERARFVIMAPYSRWKQVLRGELDPVRGMMQGKLKLRGDLPTIAAARDAAHELVRLAGTIPTRFPDE